MTARGKREAERSASPLVADKTNVRALKGRNSLRISAFQALISGARANPGRRASRLPWAFIFRTVGAYIRRWRLYRAVGAYICRWCLYLPLVLISAVGAYICRWRCPDS